MSSKDSIGYNSVEKILLDYSLCESGGKLLKNISFSTDFQEINKNLTETDEMKTLLQMYPQFPSTDYFDLTDVIEQIKTSSKILDLEELLFLRASLISIANILVIIYESDSKLFQSIHNLIENVSIPVEIFEILDKILDEKGNIKDSASEHLFEVRKKIISKEKEINKRMAFIVKNAKEQGLIGEDANASVRNDSFVLPVQAVNKNKIRGLVHSISNTGQTFFIEPEEIRLINNETQELKAEERAEIIRILAKATTEIRLFAEILLEAYKFLAYMDFLRAKAKFAIKSRAVKPILNDFPIIEWFNARHPILEFSLNKQDKKIVALDIRLDEDDRVLVISGPNAGGKSVCLKTVGLLQYMLQCGLLIPLDEQSEAGIFDIVFIDIGDKQSIENDLSTYSSHIKNMADLLKNANDKTLFLCDELGSGTEPQIGGAIAESIVEELVKKQSFGIITTHYANLKLLPDKLPHIVNAAMLFDTESHKPLYILNIGSPGSSFAMEMARNMGLSEKILKSAEAKVGTKHLDFEVQLQQLEVEKKILAKKEQELQVADEVLEETIKKFKASNEKIENQRDAIINQAKKEAKNILSSTNKLIENTIAEIKKAEAEKVKTKEIRQNFEVEKEKILEENPAKAAKKIKPKEEESYDNLLLKLKSRFK